MTPPLDDEDAYDAAINTQLLGEILPRLWIGSVWSIKELKKLKRISSWTIISALSSQRLLETVDVQVESMKKDKQVNHIVWEVADKANAAFVGERLEEILTVMDGSLRDDGNVDDSASSAVLVHCAFGVSRSAAICAAWLISRRQYKVSQALDLIRQARPVASPNIGFLANLRAIETCNGDIRLAEERLASRKGV